MRLASVLCFLLAAGSSLADEPTLTANLIVTSEGRELFRAWRSNPPAGFSVSPVDAAERGEFLTAAVMFTGCAKNEGGNCNALLDITALDPNGNVYGKFKGQELWVDKPAPEPGRTQLGVGYMGLVIEPNDPSGEYTVVATIRDLVSGEQVTTESAFVVESPGG